MTRRRDMSTVFKLLLWLAVPGVAFAHAGEPLQPHDLWSAWRFDAGVVIPLLLSAILYARGSRLERGTDRRRRLYFWGGWAALAIALVSPLHPLGEVLFSAHMAQHEVLMLVAAPLLVLSRPLVPFLWGLPFQTRRSVGRWSKTPVAQTVWRAITRPSVAWVIHAIALWVWHVPALFQATLTSEWAHTAQHLSFLSSALLFWWSLWYANGRASYGTGVVYIFTTGAHTGLLGALLTLSPLVWYPAYAASTAAWGLTPLQDQQVGGLIMWVPAGVVYMASGLAMIATWIRESDAMALRRAGLLSIAVCAAVATMNCASTPPSVARGAQAIDRYGCGGCHVIPGIDRAHGQVGPPLDSFPSRMYIAGVLPNDTYNFTRWVRDPKGIDEKTAMPNLGVSEKDANDIASYIYFHR